ncbi:MliC family protein [Wielerella bovis]|uniref:MliC family protein n=1 Tax=Wielerella bovis TaxID=2917790 RepID=UPI0020188F28|nr:MliC family protein [Wielerella bovis]ULJ69517.1 MliC family protein [Wielerella bovis]
MKKIVLTVSAVALALGMNVAQAAPKKVTGQKFECKNGATVTMKRLGGDKVRVYVDTIGASTILRAAPTGSGERYISNRGFYKKGTEFQVKGKDAHLIFNDPYKNVVETSCRRK